MSHRIKFLAAASCCAFAAFSYAATTGGTGTSAASTPALVVVSVTPTPTPSPTAVKIVTPAPTPTPTPTPAVTVAATPKKLAKLAPLNLSDMWLWNWNGIWIGSEWSNVDSPIGWKHDHITQVENGNTRFKLDAAGAPEIQGGNGTAAYGRGLWETDVTLPTMKDGLVVAPLWLYDPSSKDEVDFEYAGRKGLDVTLHGKTPSGQITSQTVRLFAGRDMSGERHRFGIKVDETFGYVEMYFDGDLVQRWDKKTSSFFISHPLKPWIQMWATNPTNAGLVYWTGKWAGLAPKETLTMIVHGYGYSSIQ